MQPWVLLETAQTPDGATLRLFRRGQEISIRLADGNELMNSRLSGSETALARLAMDRLADRPAPRLLIGGLGMGFTLRAALAVCPGAARIEVAEIVPELIDWADGPMAEVFHGCLQDPRVSVTCGDVGAVIRAARAQYDAILLDVDNGPDGLTRSGNDALYGPAGLAAARQALRPGGVLAVWSAAPDRRFARRLTESGFDTTTESVRAGPGRRGARHTIWLAARR
jgi:spermidine synthase